MIIHHISPFSCSKNIGLEYNERISELPNDCYIALSDGDALFLLPDWGTHIKDIIINNPQYGVITCMTNRLALEAHCVPNMFDCDSILEHVKTAHKLRQEFGNSCVETDIAPGLLMIFKKSLWEDIKFKENSIIFDKVFSREVIARGGKIGLAKGLYMLHLYRYGLKNPKLNINHLL